MPKTKGAVVREFLRWYAREQPRGALRRVWEELPPDAQRELDPEAEALGVLPSTWYEAGLIVALIEAVQRQLGPSSDAVIAEGVREGIRASAHGIYRWLLHRVVTPEMYARNIQRLWNMMHDTGSREIVITSKTTAVSTTRDWAGHHPVICTSTIEAMAAILELTGCKNVKARRTACVSEGAEACVAEFSWTR